MYVRHPPEEHDESVQKRKAGQKYFPPDIREGLKPDGASNPPPSDKPVTPRSKLVLKEPLRQVLCGKLMLSDEDVDQLIAEIEK